PGRIAATHCRRHTCTSTSRIAATGAFTWSYTLLTDRRSTSGTSPAPPVSRRRPCTSLHESPSLGYELNDRMGAKRRVRVVHDAIARLQAAFNFYEVAVDGTVAHVAPLGRAAVGRDHVH